MLAVSEPQEMLCRNVSEDAGGLGMLIVCQLEPSQR
jgi:hypothetical protein